MQIGTRDSIPFALREEVGIRGGGGERQGQKVTHSECPAGHPEPPRPRGKEVTVRMKSSLLGRGRPSLVVASFKIARKRPNMCPMRARTPLPIREKERK